jgi:hypothetical protein
VNESEIWEEEKDGKDESKKRHSYQHLISAMEW